LSNEIDEGLIKKFRFQQSRRGKVDALASATRISEISTLQQAIGNQRPRID
jgi:hypothetical protein